ncbi:transcription-repair coupling factor [bacterium]|nr:transcription-repair coupling factor [bacterium]
MPMSLSHLLTQVSRLNEFEEILTSSKNPKTLSIPSTSGKACFLAALFKSLNMSSTPIGGKNCLTIFPTLEEAEKFYEDLRAFLPSAHYFPAWEILPYEELSPHSEITGERLKILNELTEKKEKIFVVTSLKAFLFKLLPVQVLKESKVYLKTGSQIDRDKLIKSLFNLGYEREEMVENRGTMSVRGGIVDLFPVTFEHPLRIELFGDEIESIRQFNIESQRSIAHLKEATILPAKEVILNEEIAFKFSDLLASSQGLEQYLPFFYPELSSLPDYLEKEDIIVACEPDALEEEAERLSQETLSLYQEAKKEKKLVAHPENLIISYPEMVERLREREVYHFSDLGYPDYPLSIRPAPSFAGNFNYFRQEMSKWQKKGCTVIFTVSYQGQKERLAEILNDEDLNIIVAGLSAGFEIPSLGLILLTEEEVFGKTRLTRRKRFKHEDAAPISSYIELSVGDFVVHLNYGIGRYQGLVNILADNLRRDLLLIEYADGDKLYIPPDQLDLVGKYICDEDHPPKIHSLSSNAWEKTKKKVKESIQDMAQELIDLYAHRMALKGYSFSRDSAWQQEFEAGFVYEETPDQIKAIEDIKMDMEKPQSMDRLVCGDVGYGKTEVAIRAAFKAVMDGKQAAVLVPTTILAYQHLTTFNERLGTFPINVEMLSRFKTPGQQRQIVEGLKRGEVDIVIGTHRLIQDDVKFSNLGLLVIDEEQRFGVTHKEKIKKLKKLVDCLTMSATPIPRTLHMSLSGIRDMSIIDTPPEGRLPIRTYVTKFKKEVIREATLRELDRGGQVYFVHNRVETILGMKGFLERIIPEARIKIAHGQMPERTLEKVILEFLDHKFDMLLSTSIIESGIDIPRVNTIIINDAHRFGLSQLYQLKGRVGRAKHRAYAYLFYPPKLVMSKVTKKRLSVIREFSDLGSGFRIAMEDLQIRGAGNILGRKQHGNLSAVGFDLYCQLLKEATARLKGEPVEEEISPQIELGIEAYLPEGYVPSSKERFSIYKKISSLKEFNQLEDLEEELADRYGKRPEVVKRLFELTELRILAKKARISTIKVRGLEIALKLSPGEETLEKVVGLALRYPKKVRLCVEEPDLLLVKEKKEDIPFLKEVLSELSLTYRKDIYCPGVHKAV